MVVGVCTVQLEFYAQSLKDKRSVIKPILARVRDHFNVSAAEVDDLDAWQRSTLAFACVSTDADYAHGLLTKVVTFIEQSHFDANILDFQIEFL
ncbi:MAG: DUF503 domain-containing protein [Anaerolineae bacterium]